MFCRWTLSVHYFSISVCEISLYVHKYTYSMLFNASIIQSIVQHLNNYDLEFIA